MSVRVVENGHGGFEVEARIKGKWIAIGNSCSSRRNAEIKASRLQGHRDHDTPLAEWRRYYGWPA